MVNSKLFRSNIKNKCLSSWHSLPLNKKFSSLIVCVLTIPTVLSVFLIFNTMQQEEQESIILKVQGDMEKLYSFSFSNSSMASAVIQLVKSNPQLEKALEEPLTTAELMDFHKEVTPYFESIAITNPFIRSVRIYADEEKMPERYPVFVDSSRLKNEIWFQEAEEGFMKMRVNYDENLSSQISQYKGNALISFYENIGNESVVEVSFTLADFFGDVFTTEESGICFVKKGSQIMVSKGVSLTFGEEKIYRELIETWGEEALDATLEVSKGSHFLMTGKSCPDLDVDFYIISDLSQKMTSIQATQVFYVFIICVVFACFAYIFERIANVLLGRIYKTIDAMHQLELGNTLVQIENPSLDEVGHLQRYFNQMVVRIDELVEQESKRAILEKDAELKALQNQINAHFLYNVLNNIEMMAIIDENFMIADSVTALARLLRYSMKWDKQMVPLSSELEYVKDYIQLFNMRFDNEIELICDVSQSANEALIPKMSVQPVVENAIVHGIEDRMRDEIIRISAKVDAERLTIGITDTGIGMTEEELETLRTSLNHGRKEGGISGIGLNNVRERIEKRFGSGYGISIESKLGEYTKVTLEMPYLEENTELQGGST